MIHGILLETFLIKVTQNKKYITTISPFILPYDDFKVFAHSEILKEPALKTSV